MEKQHRYGCHEWNPDFPFCTNRIHISKWKAGFNSIFLIPASSVTWLWFYNTKYHSNKILRMQVIKIQKWFIKMTLRKNSSILYSNLFTLVEGSHTLLHSGVYTLAQGTVQVKLAEVFKNGICCMHHILVPLYRCSRCVTSFQYSVLYPSTWPDHLDTLINLLLNINPLISTWNLIGTHPANWALPVTTAVSKPELIRQTLGMIHTKTQVTYQHLSRQMAFKTIPVMIFCFPVLQKIQNILVWHSVKICRN